MVSGFSTAPEDGRQDGRQPDTLLIAASFFGYAAALTAELERRGRKVLWFEDRPGIDVRSKALIRVSPSLIAARAEAYFGRIAAQISHMPIREVLVIKGEALSNEATRCLRRAAPRAEFTLYFWDSYRNMPGDSPAKVDLFDRAFSFDPGDVAADSRLAYRPLFFRPEYESLPKATQDTDLLFIGTLHTDRHAVLRRIAAALPPDVRFERILYSRSRAIHRVERLLRPSMWLPNGDTTIFVPLSASEIVQHVAGSRTLVDIERPVQSGLTMRTLEALGAQRKLITTNREVMRADFFDPANILVIDRRHPVVPDEFLRTPYRPPPGGIVDHYSIRGWLDEVLPQTAHRPSTEGQHRTEAGVSMP